MTHKLDVAGVLNRVFNLYGHQAGVLLPAALIVFLPVAILHGLVGTAGGGALLMLVAAALSLVGNVWYQGVVVEAVSDMQDGRRDFSVGQLFRSVSPVIGALLVAGLLAGVGIAIGLVLIIVPGLILLTWWALIAPAIVIERAGVIDSFGRSRELVRGNGWQVFGVIIVVFLVQAVVSAIFQGIGVGIAHNFVGYGLANLVAHVLTAPLSALAAAVMFFELRAEPAVEGTPTPAAEPMGGVPA
jgi:ABC-type multidrug transport system fused ATPase/permease subunit